MEGGLDLGRGPRLLGGSLVMGGVYRVLILGGTLFVAGSQFVGCPSVWGGPVHRGSRFLGRGEGPGFWGGPGS